MGTQSKNSLRASIGDALRAGASQKFQRENLILPSSGESGKAHRWVGCCLRNVSAFYAMMSGLVFCNSDVVFSVVSASFVQVLDYVSLFMFTFNNFH
ncbi:uncharacterized protein LOC110228295 [Arabidopsis lyrata subsp. lyrata]|uniref:uncharacterized protein LOC110228295 n=1 Tax=Arabidopsis lyrata subsp. lyrata TaxID=81972 RepID=UPI000A29AA89|nr:uncharacterized protein LOC110228295 [Arabidopsis lyrata subsp. lyrata]|eukprot:XP_020880780.1 uncharacterized protein LOC110228295 [Arabidopsis lyrata subsp. lyrata]